MLRIGGKVIVSFPNFGHWRIRTQFLITGKMPITKGLPYTWYETPNIHFFTLYDFQSMCDNSNIFIEKSIGLTENGKQFDISEKSILSNLYGIRDRLKIKDYKPKFLAITPLFHNNGQFIPTLLPLMIGGSTTPIQSDTSLLTFWNVCIKNRINYSSVMATHINYFLKMKPNIRGNKLKGLFCGGAKLDENSRKIFEKRFKIKIATNYGLTETSSIVSSEVL